MASAITTYRIWLLNVAVLVLVACSGSDTPSSASANVGTNTSTLTQGMSNDSESAASIDTDTSINRYELAAAPVNDNPDFTRVLFDIRVPAYQSNALRVDIEWLGETLEAHWVGDEYWTALVDYPSERSGTLNIYFYDDNGGIVLGSYTANELTDERDNTVYRIMPDQFNTARWDDDLDGGGNLAELIAGTDPNVRADPSSLPVLYTIPEPRNFADTYANSLLSRYSAGYEEKIPDARPYFSYETYEPEYQADGSFAHGNSRTVNTQIDTLGNGSYSFENIFRDSNTSTTERFVGNRSNTGTSINWEGSAYRLDTGAYRGYEFEFSVSTAKLNNDTFTQRGTISGGSIGYAVGEVSIDYNFIGSRIPGSDNCLATSGNASFNDRYDDDPFDIDSDVIGPINYNFDVFKTPADEFWSVTVFDTDMQFVQSFFVQTLSFSFSCCLLYTSPSPRDKRQSRMPSSA